VYDLHPLAVRGETGLRLELTPGRARRLLEAPAAVRRGLDGYAERLAPFAARNGRSSGAVSLASWLAERRPDLAAGSDPGSVEPFALAAELFGIRCDAAELRAVARVVREGGGTPALPLPYRETGQREHHPPLAAAS
jgi:hypothetical protein